MKKFVAFLLAAAACLSLAACAAPKTAPIVCTAFPQYDFVKNIVGSDENVLLIADNGADLHSYEMTPQDIVAVSNADILITVGGESDKWAEEAAEGKAVYKIEICSFCDVVCHEDHDHEDFDEHVWLSPKNAIKIVEGLSAVLCEKYPENAEKYRENTARYIEKLEELDKKFESLPKGEMIVADRFPFAYLAVDYGISYTAAFDGCSAETEASFAKMAELITAAERVGAKYIFKTDNSNLGLAEKVAESTGASVGILNSLQSATAEEIADGLSYLSKTEENYERLKAAFE